MENNPADIPKEDLLHLCMKMNKRMQAMETKGQELVKKKVSLLNERKQLLDAIKERVAVPLNLEDDQDLDMRVVTESINKSEEQRRTLITSIEHKFEVLEQSKEVELIASESKYRKEIMDLQRLLTAATGPAATSVRAEAESDGDDEGLEHSRLLKTEADSNGSNYLVAENERLTKQKEVS